MLRIREIRFDSSNTAAQSRKERSAGIRVLRRSAIPLAAAALLAACGGHVSDPAPSDPWPASNTNTSFLPDVGTVTPARVLRVSGNVSGADSLVNGGSATLTYEAGQPAPQIVLDYGHEVGGLPFFNVLALTGSPTLSGTFSESAPNIDTGDITAGLTVAADPSRVSQYPVSAPGVLTSSVVQGGERYEVISLSTPGSLTLGGAGIRSLYQAPTSSQRGSFASSSSILNQIWTSGAYTVELDRLAAGVLPLAWTATSDGFTIGSSGVGTVQKSGTWSGNYTMSFDLRIDRNSGGWVVRDTNHITNLQFILHSGQDTAGTPNTLEFAASNAFVGGKKTFASLPLPSDIAPGTWHSVQTSLNGGTVKVSIDGTQIGVLDADALGASAILLAPSGSAGFYNAAGNQATYRNLVITSSSGATLYSNTLQTIAALNDFEAGTNSGPLLIDGAKRDRNVWSGDIAVEGPTLYYSSYQTDAVANSIRLFGSYIRSNGEVSTTHSDQAPLITDSADNYSSSNFYSAQYSVYFVSLLYDYYLHTGDASLLSQQWPAVKSELSYMSSLIDGNGLVSVSAADAQDWNPNFTDPLTGEVTSTNLLYFRALTQAAELAKVADGGASSAGYLQQAANLKQAINAHLFNASAGFYGMSASTPSALAQDANSLAVLTGVAPAGSSSSILATIASDLASPYGRLAFSSDSGRGTPVVSPFVSDLEVRARFETGDTSGALSLIQTLWGHMLSTPDYYTGATWEAIAAADGNPPSPQTSLAHGWSSGATSALSEYVLGIRPVSGGYQQWIVKPHPGSLQWVIGQAPTPFGAISVKWGVTGNHGFSMEVTVPTGTSGTIAIPSSSSAVKLNGKPVTTTTTSALDTSISGPSASAYRYIDGIGPGTYRISADGS